MYVTWRWDGFQGLTKVVGGLLSVELDGISRVRTPAQADVGTGLSLCCFDARTQSYVKKRVPEFETWPLILLVRTLRKGLSLSGLWFSHL